MGTVKTQVNKEEEENGASPEDSVQGCTKTSIDYLQTQVIFCSFFKFSKILKQHNENTGFPILPASCHLQKHSTGKNKTEGC